MKKNLSMCVQIAPNVIRFEISYHFLISPDHFSKTFLCNVMMH